MSIENAVTLAVETKNFSNMLESTKISMDELMTLSEIVPSLNDSIQIICDWVQNDVVHETVVVDVDTSTGEVITQEEPYLSVEENTKKQPRIVVDNETVIEMAKFVSSACNSMRTIEAFRLVMSAFGEVKPDTVKRLVYKYSFAPMTDPYFKIRNHRIVGKYSVANGDDTSDDKPNDEQNYPEIPEGICNKDALIRFLNGVKPNVPIDEFCRIWQNLEMTAGDISRYIIDDNVDGDECIRYIIVKQAMISSQIFQYIDDPEMVVMISDGVRKYGKKRTNRITNYVMKHYGMRSLPPKTFTELMFGVINKKIYPEISDKFFK